MAKEGFYFYLPFVAAAVVFFWLYSRNPQMNYVYLAASFFIFGSLLLLFFRDPERKVPEGDDVIVSPADGKVVAIEEHDSILQISIFLSIFNVHINRIPVSGEVKRVEHKSGKFIAAFNPEASEVNERSEVEIITDRGTVKVHQIAGILARRVICRLENSQVVSKGDRFGLIMFGSRVDLFLPLSVKLEIKIGQQVKGAKSIIGRFV